MTERPTRAGAPPSLRALFTHPLYAPNGSLVDAGVGQPYNATKWLSTAVHTSCRAAGKVHVARYALASP